MFTSEIIEMHLTSASLFQFGCWFSSDSYRINLDLVMISNPSDFTKQAGNISGHQL
jgi:hypothetical protein